MVREVMLAGVLAQATTAANGAAEVARGHDLLPTAIAAASPQPPFLSFEGKQASKATASEIPVRSRTFYAMLAPDAVAHPPV